MVKMNTNKDEQIAQAAHILRAFMAVYEQPVCYEQAVVVDEAIDWLRNYEDENIGSN